MKIYISGPITNNPMHVVQFAKAANAIKDLGHEAVNPVDLQKMLDPKTTSWEQYMQVCIALLKVCDAIYLLDGWQNSKGATKEFHLAMTHNMVIYKHLGEVAEL